jgi:hypothetical protein
MNYTPPSIPAMDAGLRRGLFIGHISRRPIDVLFRGVNYTAARSDPSLQRKTNQAGYIQEVSDMEIMLSLPDGTAKPVAHSTDEVRIYDPQRAVATRTYTDYRIVNVQTDIAADCYQLTLTKRNT